MAENLKTTKYRDGSTAIPLVTGNTDWYNLTSPGYCWYDNNIANKDTFGALYNWYTPNTGNLCPTGWHVPADADWTLVTNYLNGNSDAGGKLKEAGTAHWLSPNTGTNESGFTALPGGYRVYEGAFNLLGDLGSWWSATQGDGPSANYISLRYLTNYVAKNGNGKEAGFSVRCIKDMLTTIEASSITQTSAISGGNVPSDGETVTARGVCWNTSGNPTIADNNTNDGTSTGIFTSSITGLTENTTYYVRAYATTSFGTSYGSQVSFATTGHSGTVTDFEGNIYKTITIGSQIWMAENLKTTKYNDGTAIPNVTDDGAWAALTTGAYSDYNNTPANSTTYGRLYNWYAVDNNAATKVASNGGKNVCPTSWHVPTDTEWTTLITYLGGENVAGGKLKETGTTHWASPNTGATNETGFTALPGGYRGYMQVGSNGYWWIPTEYSSTSAWFRVVVYTNANVYRIEWFKQCGFSVRCVRDF
jgi:uncharacterized protein (TIGR02145 family)